MSRYTTRLFLGILLLLPVLGQGQVIVTDSIPKSQMWAPTFVRIGTELINPIRSVLGNRTSGWEVEVETDFHRYVAVFDYGFEKWTFSDTTYMYESSGNYYRVGLDANLIPRDKFGSSLYFGLRYGQGSFEEELVGTVSYPQWGSSLIDGENREMRVQWFEMVMGMKAKVWKGLVLGYTLRLKLSPEFSDPQEFETYRIPGYGIGRSSNFWGISYYVAWQFQFRQKYMVPPRG